MAPICQFACPCALVALALRAISSVEEFIAFEDAGWVKYLTDFHVRPCPAGTVLSTETRGYSTDRATRRRFAISWAAIRTGPLAVLTVAGQDRSQVMGTIWLALI